MSDRKVHDKKYNEKRNDVRMQLVFNMDKKEDLELYNKFLRIQEYYKASANSSLKNLIMEKNIE